MEIPNPFQRFGNDQRAVSAVIGFILIFGILVLLLTVYQAQIVPQQNAQTEFEHFEDSQNELIELRNAISTAGQADVSQFPSVTLGTNYQTRLFTINPAPPAGTLQTSERHNITVSNGTAEHDLNIPTRFLEYQPGYNEIRVGPTRYEHSVLYLDERERGNNVSIIEDQHLVKDGKVRITALQNEFQQTGTNRVTLELYPEDEVDASEFPEPENGENLTVTVPTKLEEDYWEESLPEGIYNDFETEKQDDEPNTLNLSVDDEDLELNTVGIQLEPDEGPAKNTVPHRDSGDQDPTGEEATSVFVSADQFTPNDDINTDFGVSNNGQTFNFNVNIDDGGPNDGIVTQEVTIDSETFELTDQAAEAITSDVDTDILNADNYQGTDQSDLNQFREEIDTTFQIDNESNNGDRPLTTIDIRQI